MQWWGEKPELKPEAAKKKPKKIPITKFETIQKSEPKFNRNSNDCFPSLLVSTTCQFYHPHWQKINTEAHSFSSFFGMETRTILEILKEMTNKK